MTNMTSQADRSSSASVLSLKHRRKSSLLMFQYVWGLIFVDIWRKIGKIGFKHRIYPQFTLVAAQLSSREFHHMYRDRSPPYPLWFAFASKEEKGRIDKILELRNNYCIDRTKQIRLTKERFEIKRSAIHWTCDETDKIMVMGQPGLVRYLSNHHQNACLWTDQKPQTFFMRKLPTSAPKKLERPFVATSAVWLWDTLQAWEGYAISRHSTKSLHGALMNASIFFLQGFLSLTPDNKPLKFSAPEWYTTEGILWTASFSTDWN